MPLDDIADQTPGRSAGNAGAKDPWRNTVCPTCDVRGLTFCGGFNTTALDRMQTTVTHLKLAPGETLTSEGMPADHVFNIASGSMKLYKLMADGRRQIVAFLAEGDFVGLDEASRYSYSVDALSAVRLCRMPRRKLEQLLEEFPEARNRFHKIATNDLAEAQDHMLLLGRKTAEEKVASFFVQLANKAVARGGARTELHLAMNRIDIADYLGLTIETISRTLTILRKRNLIETPSPSHVLICDYEAVANLAEGADT